VWHREESLQVSSDRFRQGNQAIEATLHPHNCSNSVSLPSRTPSTSSKPVHNTSNKPILAFCGQHCNSSGISMLFVSVSSNISRKDEIVGHSLGHALSTARFPTIVPISLDCSSTLDQHYICMMTLKFFLQQSKLDHQKPVRIGDGYKSTMPTTRCILNCMPSA
jgi:hypothetical protein